jgi:ABC-type nitrate/sulfonate/bicarbonate transport system substrate-binding protein
MKRFRILGFLLVLALLIPAFAFAGGGRDRAGGGELATGPTTFGLQPLPQRETLRIGFFAGSPLSYPFLFADKEGFFRELNIDIVYSTFTNGPAMMEANSTWDIAGCGLGGMLVGMVGHDMRIIGISDYEENMALFAKPGSRLAQERNNPAVWRGTQWLYPQGTTAQAVLAAALSNLGLTLQDIRSTNMDVVSALTGFHSQGDGLAVWNAIAFAAEDRGYIRLHDAGTLGIAFPCGTLASDATIRSKLDLVAYAYIIFYKTVEWINASPANFNKAVQYYLEHCLDEGIAVDESIARRVMEWFRAPGVRRSIEIMTETAPDAAGLYTRRNLSQAERDILVGFDFFIAERRYTPEHRVNVLDRGLVDDRVARRAAAIMQEQGIRF